MPSRFVVAIAMALLASQAGAALAQDVPAPVGTADRRYRLDRVCADSLKRFCPALAETPGQTRNQVICLKPYRTSLPLSCRSAVTTAMR